MLALEQICSGGMFLSAFLKSQTIKIMGFLFGKTLGYQGGHLIGSFFSLPLSHLGWDTNLSEK